MRIEENRLRSIIRKILLKEVSDGIIPKSTNLFPDSPAATVHDAAVAETYQRLREAIDDSWDPNNNECAFRMAQYGQVFGASPDLMPEKLSRHSASSLQKDEWSSFNNALIYLRQVKTNVFDESQKFLAKHVSSTSTQRHGRRKGAVINLLSFFDDYKKGVVALRNPGWAASINYTSAGQKYSELREEILNLFEDYADALEKREEFIAANPPAEPEQDSSQNQNTPKKRPPSRLQAKKRKTYKSVFRIQEIIGDEQTGYWDESENGTNASIEKWLQENSESVNRELKRLGVPEDKYSEVIRNIGYDWPKAAEATGYSNRPAGLLKIIEDMNRVIEKDKEVERSQKKPERKPDGSKGTKKPAKSTKKPAKTIVLDPNDPALQDLADEEMVVGQYKLPSGEVIEPYPSVVVSADRSDESPLDKFERELLISLADEIVSKNLTKGYEVESLQAALPSYAETRMRAYREIPKLRNMEAAAKLIGYEWADWLEEPDVYDEDGNPIYDEDGNPIQK